MKKSGLVFLILLLTAVFFTSASANPFTRKPLEGHPRTGVKTVQSPKAGAEPGILMTITMTQKKIRSKMVQWIREARTQGSFMPLFWVLGGALVYGMVHSAGPGHGKAVALSYIFCFKPGLGRGLLFGNVLAFSHGMSGVGLVLAVKFIFEVSVGTSLESVTRGTQIFSYSLIALLGGSIFLGALKKCIFPVAPGDTDCVPDGPSLFTAFVMGMIPCPGVVMSMLFCISMDLTLFGVLTGLAISVGMAITLSSLVLACILGKTVFARGAAMVGTGAPRIEFGIEALSGFIVAVLGVLFLLATL